MGTCHGTCERAHGTGKDLFVVGSEGESSTFKRASKMELGPWRTWLRVYQDLICFERFGWYSL